MMSFKATIKFNSSSRSNYILCNSLSIRKFSRNISLQNNIPPGLESHNKFFSLAMNEYTHRNLFQSIQYFKQADQYQPNHPYIIFMLAHVNETLKNFEQAYNYYQQFIEIENSCEYDKLSDKYQELFSDKIVKAWLGAGNCFYASRNFEKALSFYSKAVEYTMFPFHKAAFYNRASCYYELGKFRQAIDDFTIAVDYFSEEHDDEIVGVSTVTSELDISLCYFSRASCKWDLGEIESAVNDLEILINDYEQIEKHKFIHHNVLKKTNCRLTTYLMILEAYLSLGEYEKFLINMERLEKNDQKHFTNVYLSHIHMLKGVYYLNDVHTNDDGDLESALEHFTKSCELNPNNCEAHIKAAIIHDTKEDKFKALQLINRALEIEPNNDNAKKILEIINN